MRVLDLFSGIGGFSLGLERTGGFETVAFCEIEKFPQKVLKKHWPEVPIYTDVKELTNARLEADGIFGIDVITGGFPCQDISVAGKQAGIGEGTRSGLWSEVARLISDIQPRYAIMENVTALISGDSGRWFGRVLGDLAEIGYDAEWHCISASELGAHHHRDRVWIIAYPSEQRCNHGADNRQERHIQANKERGFAKAQPERDKRESRACASCSILSNSMRLGRKAVSVRKGIEGQSEEGVRAKSPANNRLRISFGERENGRTGALNPNWVEWLMGYPIGHTDLKGLETQ